MAEHPEQYNNIYVLHMEIKPKVVFILLGDRRQRVAQADDCHNEGLDNRQDLMELQVLWINCFTVQNN